MAVLGMVISIVFLLQYMLYAYSVYERQAKDPELQLPGFCHSYEFIAVNAMLILVMLPFVFAAVKLTSLINGLIKESTEYLEKLKTSDKMT